jgi:ubiquinone biosynthesis accessory factor UbiJ
MPDPITTLSTLVLPAATARFVLLANHVLTAAPVAPERLKAHVGRVLRIEVEGWSLPLPPPPPLALRITPAGLLEAVEAAEALDGRADLRLRVDATDPLAAARRVATGQLPTVHIEGDVSLAADVNWVIANVRWDIAADLERVFGPAVADGLSRLGGSALNTLRAVAQGAASVMRRG